MKIFLISAFLCLATLTHGANIQRLARNTEAIIPTIVEEILKVELQSDLKKNSAVEAIEESPIIKSIVSEDIIVEPVVSRKVEEVLAAEEKKPEIVEIVAVKEVIPEAVPATRNVEPLVEIIEKVEVIAIQENAEKPVDNFRTESVPSIEQVPEIIKETVVVAPVSALKEEPAAVILLKEEEIVQPMFRNVVKEEIPQVEALRNVPVETDAVKDIIPEPIAAANIVEPVVEIFEQVKTLELEPLKVAIKEDIPVVSAVKEVPAVAVVPVEIKAEEPVIAEIKEEIIEVAIIPEIKAVPEIKLVEIVAAPAVALPEMPESAIPSVDGEIDPESRQDRPTLVQTIQNNLAGLPVVGQIFNRVPAVAAADEVISEDSAPAPAPAQGPVAEFISNAISGTQQFVSNAQNFVGNAVNSINPPASNNAEANPNPIVAFVQTAFSNVQNAINPTTASSAIKDEVKPEKVEKPVKIEKPVEEKEKPIAAKSVEPEAQVVVDPVVVQKEVVETQKIVEAEKENIVKV